MLAAPISQLRQTVSTGTTRPIGWRLEQLERLERSIAARADAVLAALAADLNKPPVEAYFELMGVQRELKLCRRELRHWMAPRPVGVPLSLQPARAEVISEPLGCVLIIGPWNYPFHLCLKPLVSALAAGNTAVLKPSELAPATASLIADLIHEAFPDSTVQVVQGDGSTAAALLEEPFDHIFFTGSERIGRLVMAAAARQLTPVTLELGGKSPAVVLADADLNVTARRLVWGKSLNAGQTCIAPDHLFVQREIADALITRMGQRIVDCFGVEPLSSPDLGRIVNREQYRRLSDLLEGARQRGQLVHGGQCDPTGLRIAPTLIRIESPDDPLMQEELFGPLLPVLAVTDLEEAITLINRRAKPLALYLFGGSHQQQRDLLARTSSGGVAFNEVVLQASVPGLPFGGVGASGMGAYHGKAGFDTFSHRRSVLRRPFRLDAPFRYPPYEGRLPLIRRLLG
jgi:aldehyde dehydrogenase (NAD+)